MAVGLEGIKVVEMAAVTAGPMATRLLSDWGADVIHIEQPVRGDMAAIMPDIDYAVHNYNISKRAMTLDLFQEGGREILYKLVKKVDVFLTNFRPCELEKFKLEYETLNQLNPRLIYGSVTGYGKKGSGRNASSYEHTGYFTRSGILHVLQVPGTHPPQPPLGFGDNIAGLCLACGVMAALFIRERTGVGQEVDVSLFQTGVFTHFSDIAGALATGQDRQQSERKDTANAMVNAYQTKDGRWLRLEVGQPDLYWSRVCQVIEREDLEHDPRFATFEPRIENHAALFGILEEVFLSKTLDEWKVRLNEAGLPWDAVQNLPEVISDPQARANDFFVSLEHPTYGRIEVVANPIKLSKTPASVVKPAPEFGQHTEGILLENSYTRGDIARFKEQGVIA